MEKNSYKGVYDRAVSLINKGEFTQGYELVKEFSEVRNILLYRVFYMLFSNKKSPVYSPNDAKQRIDGLVKFGDNWGAAEKGRCLLHGVFYKKSVVEAEDLLVKAGEEQLTALYFRAEIHFKGLHVNASGEQVFDLEEAEILYRQVISKTKDKGLLSKSKLNLCKLLMQSSEMTQSSLIEVYSLLLSLRSQGSKAVEKVFFDFLSNNMNSLIPTVFDDKAYLSDHKSKIDNETRRRSFRKSLSTMKSSIYGDVL